MINLGIIAGISVLIGLFVCVIGIIIALIHFILNTNKEVDNNLVNKLEKLAIRVMLIGVVLIVSGAGLILLIFIIGCIELLINYIKGV